MDASDDWEKVCQFQLVEQSNDLVVCFSLLIALLCRENELLFQREPSYWEVRSLREEVGIGLLEVLLQNSLCWPQLCQHSHKGRLPDSRISSDQKSLISGKFERQIYKITNYSKQFIFPYFQ